MISLGIAAVMGMFVAIQIGPSALLGSVQGGLNRLEEEVDVPTTNTDVRGVIVDSLVWLVSFLALVAVVAIVIAGFVFILGFGTEASITRGKKIIIYTIVGIIVVFFASAIVSFFTEELVGNVT